MGVSDKINRFLLFVFSLALGLSAWAGVARVDRLGEEFTTVGEALARAGEFAQKFSSEQFSVSLLASCTEDVEIPVRVSLNMSAGIRLTGTVAGAGTIGLSGPADRTQASLESWIGADGIVFGDFTGTLQLASGSFSVTQAQVPATVSTSVGRDVTLEYVVPEGDMTVASLIKGSGTIRKSGAGTIRFTADNWIAGVLDIAGGTVYGSFDYCHITGTGLLILENANPTNSHNLPNEAWQGTVWVKDYHDQQLFSYAPYGKIRLTDVTDCYLHNARDLTGCSFELVDEDGKIALDLYSRYDLFFNLGKMTGSGTFRLSQKDDLYTRYAINDLTEFSGRIIQDASCATLVLGADEEVLWKPGDVLIMGPVKASSIEVKTEGKGIILARKGAKLTVAEKLPDGLVRTSVDKMKVVYDEATKTYELAVEYVTVKVPELENRGNITATQNGESLRFVSIEGDDDAFGFIAKVGSVVTVTYEPYFGYIGGGTLTLTITEDMTTFELPESFKTVPAVAMVMPRDEERYEEQRWFRSLAEAVAAATDDDYVAICTDVADETIELAKDLEIQVWPTEWDVTEIGATFTGPGRVSFAVDMGEVVFTKDITVNDLFLKYGFVGAAPGVTVRIAGTLSGALYLELGKVTFAPNAVFDLTQDDEATCIFETAPTFEGVLQVVGVPDAMLFASLDGNLTLPTVVGLNPGSRTPFDAVAEFGETFEEWDETYYTVVFKAAPSDYPYFVGTDAARRAKYDAWAGRPAAPADALEAAYLFNCANTPEAVEAAQAAFKVTITVGADGEVTVLPPEGASYNGTFVVEGIESLDDDDWKPKAANHRFFRGLLR